MKDFLMFGGLTNGFFTDANRRIYFLPYDSMRQFRSKEEIEKEIRVLIEKVDDWSER